MIDILDLEFPLTGDDLPLDHAYPLYAALSRRLPWLHGASPPVDAGEAAEPAPGVFPVVGRPTQKRTLALSPRSRLRVRLPAHRLAEAASLAGERLKVAGQCVTTGPPTLIPLRPCPTLVADLVTIKLAHHSKTDPLPFLQAVDRQLAALGVEAEAGLRTHSGGERAGQPHRKVLRIRGAIRVGYPVVVMGLTADDSLQLQRHGLGGRRRMGCGLFRVEKAG